MNMEIYYLATLAAQYATIRGCRSVFETGIRYFPKKKGINLLFRKDDNDNTPFRRACEQLGYKEVMKVIEDTLTPSSSSTSDNNIPQLNIMEALIMAALMKIFI
jgi:hypothetical protein